MQLTLVFTSFKNAWCPIVLGSQIFCVTTMFLLYFSLTFVNLLYLLFVYFFLTSLSYHNNFWCTIWFLYCPKMCLNFYHNCFYSLISLYVTLHFYNSSILTFLRMDTFFSYSNDAFSVPHYLSKYQLFYTHQFKDYFINLCLEL